MPLVRRLLKKIWEEALLFEGSTRPVALLRIGLVFLIWTSWAYDFRLPITIRINPTATWLGISFFIASFFMFIGLWTRWATAWMGITLLIMHAYLGKTLGLGGYSYGVHHQYLLVLLTGYLALTPSGRSYSVDRWLAVRRALKRKEPLPAERGPLWATRLMALQISMVYFWSAYDKTTWAFLSGQRLEQLGMFFLSGSEEPAFPGFHTIAFVCSVLAVLLEYVLSVGLWFSRSRMGCFCAGFFFHSVLYYFFNIWVFTSLMMLSYLVFIPPNRIHLAIDRLSGVAIKTR